MTPEKKPVRTPPFNPEELISAACREAGVNAPDLLDTPGLRALCAGLNTASDVMNFIGRGRSKRLLIETLIKRLRVHHHLQREPSIRDIDLRAPIFLVAPFRTGTTFLHRLLARDPAHRTPRLWEALQAPPLEPEYRGDPDYFEKDYRIPIARKYLETRARYTPDIAEIHPTDVDSPEECFGLLETSMLSHSFTFYGPVTDYLDWLDQRTEAEWRDAYAIYADQLRLLQWWAPADRWVLKTPFHIWSVEALHANFPDALFVQQHRDPAACVASYCSLTAAAYRPIAAGVSNEEIGRIAMNFLRDGTARNVAARRRLGPDQFIDINYQELVADPVGTTRRVYDAAGAEFPADVEADIRQWLDDQSATRKHVKHNYSLADYGLDADEVNEAFAAYSAFGAAGSNPG